MVKNDIKDQISLFDLPALEKSDTPPAAQPPASQMTPEESSSPVRKTETRTTPVKTVDRKIKNREPARSTASKSNAAKTQPGPVPEGDVRLTANIREDLHLKLKIVAATRRTTIGELIEELVEFHLK